jgi:hypothetical protein
VLYLQQGPAAAGCPAGATGCAATGRAANAGLFFGFPASGATTNAIAFDETTGQRVWTANVPSKGDGIRGTPVIDPASRKLFVVTGANPHVVHALSVDNGVEVTTGGWPVTLSNATLSYTDPTTNTKAAFNTGSQNQHGATLLVNNILYIPFGGHYGDPPAYNGWIVAVDITNPTRFAGWATMASPMADPDSRSGIWGSGGLASDGTYVFGATGDTTWNGAVPAVHSGDSQELVRVTGLAQFTRDAKSVFVPKEWTGWDQPGHDLDYGASTPAFVPLPAGSNPASLVVSPAKAGRLYVLDGTNLSSGTYPNAGGELADIVVSNTGGETVYTAPTIYTSASGLHAAINVGGGQPATGCQAGAVKSQEQIISILLQPGATFNAKVAWCASNSAGGGHQNYPPISTTTDGVSANALVWFINGTQLEVIDGDSGAHVFTTTGAACNNVPSLSFPIAVNNRIVVATLAGLCSWSLNGM